MTPNYSAATHSTQTLNKSAHHQSSPHSHPPNVGREFYYTTCPPGKHHMAPDRTGGGTCMYCGETITADEIN